MASLSERLRPRSLKEFVGQRHLFEKGGTLYYLLKREKPFSLIFWGPPGTGKTTLSYLLGKYFQAHFVAVSAVDTTLKDLKDLIKQAENLKKLGKNTILFIDEIHRFNKAQQAFLLPYVEKELIFLFGATTENPSFEIIAPLLSRVRVLQLYPLEEDEILQLLKRALIDETNGYGTYNYIVKDEVLKTIAQASQGDGRFALNTLEILVEGAIQEGLKEITLEALTQNLLTKPLLYDKSGEEHYNLISAFHKSMRGSDPDATIYWMVRMLEAGEDPLYIARRILICAAEDVGLADPLALVVALSAFKAYEILGSPEGEIALAEAALYVALAPKSNSSYLALKKAKDLIKKTGAQPVPLHLRNPVTALMEKMGYGKDYQYPHDFEHAFVLQEYLPEALKKIIFYQPKEIGVESTFKERLKKLWGKYKGYV
ncbi:ATPase AAA [Caldimicrobium thiodismutans]|uniref:Replication-associated recombination protein A n=1 Tax=Caldimicrobium thiodismutans TaxID=1653476 RepID=A0A0U5AVM3_9BACT|nr:replication-associated recombination protein A [Caldimicrobium thiodismutans]BAU22415.1 ATPase AAA [Caldimicrobium thiodismutans]